MIAVPSILLAVYLRDIQSLMKYFSSTFGFLLIIVIPIALIYYYRIKINSTQIIQGNLNRSFVDKNYQLLILSILGVGIFLIIIYGFFNVNNKHCIFEL